MTRKNGEPKPAKRVKKSLVTSGTTASKPSSSGSAGISVIPPESAPAASGLSAAVSKPPDFINGQAVKLDVQPTGAIGWKISCDTHAKCMKWRSIGHKNDVEFGEKGTEYYLGTWLAASKDMSAVEHRAWRPKPLDVNARVKKLAEMVVL